MKKLILIGRTGCGKTTLSQVLKNSPVQYEKTQFIKYGENLIDTPGEYAENRQLGAALALYTYEADIVGLLLSSKEQYSLYPPNVTSCANREVIGIVTKIDDEKGDKKQAERWLRLAGCKKIFFVSAKTGEGIEELLSYLKN